MRTESEITNADFIMNTEIKFEQSKTFYHKVKTLPNGTTARTYYENIDPEVSYVFQSKITISGYEFIKNRENIKEYVVNKLKQRSDWKEQILKYITKESETTTTFGWVDRDGNVYGNIENSVRLWSDFVVGFTEYKEDKSYKRLWDGFINKIEEQYDD